MMMGDGDGDDEDGGDGADSLVMRVTCAAPSTLLTEILSTWSSLAGDGITRLKHFRPYFLIWWTSLFSEYNHIMSDATLGIGAACLVQVTPADLP